ncbi:MAG: RbsD/FucU family protein [Planctomycetota bacterium]
MIQWEYTRCTAPDFSLLGREGWEWVTFYAGEHVFKRPAPSATDRFTREQTERALLGASDTSSNDKMRTLSTPHLLNPELAALSRRIGHTQMLLVCDAGFPAPFGLPLGTLDLSVSEDIPTVVQVLEALLLELPHDRMIIAAEMKLRSPERYAWHERHSSPIECHPHAEFKHIARDVVACIRTGDSTPYANTIIVGG